MIKQIKSTKSLDKSKLLLHVCCACCATEVYNRLKDNYEVTLFWHNPNIYPYTEHQKRLNSFVKLASGLNCNALICHSHENGNLQIVDPRRSLPRALKRGGDDKTIEIDRYRVGNSEWQIAISGLENEPEGGKRCEKCYKFRLEKTAQYARDNGFDIFTTTLTISPHKNAGIINQIGKEIAAKNYVDYLESDFKKQDGFKKSIELSHQHNLYRQNYCGCIYSHRNIPLKVHRKRNSAISTEG